MTEKSSFSADLENDLFFFESEHLALRGNEDYCEVLKTIVMLSAQREQLLKDQKRIIEIRNLVLADPEAVVEKLQNNEDLGFELPPKFETAKMPVINFDKYGVKIPESLLRETKSEIDHEIKIEEDLGNKKSNRREWTPDEQKKLEELLQTYPPEPIESRRYQKIANALGDRTLAQVTSRVQKYFQKLHKAGLPIPGRMPKSIIRSNRGAPHLRQNEPLWRPTTFFPEYSVPVEMDDDEMDCAPGPTTCGPPAAKITPDNYLLQTDYHRSASSDQRRSEKELTRELLERVIAEKEREEEDPRPPFVHVGFRCDRCGERPIVGARWHCEDCPGSSVDFCTDCTVIQTHESDPHPPSHFLAAILDEERPGMVQSGSEWSSGSDEASGSDSSAGEDADSDDGSVLAKRVKVGSPVKSGPGVKSELGGFEDGVNVGEGLDV